ncbi:MAG TPA: ABC transporter substrate-binding protein [Thermomicrobiales bacterium]|nr:ABC transporter substrate-binding protein [Thermomicrobiales bacterium]
MRSSRNSGDAGAARSHVNRRQFLAGSTALSAAILSGAAMPLAGAAQEGEGQFNAAWPFEAPPTGHINSFVPASIIGPNSVYGFALWLPLAFYTWSTEEWMPQLATNWGFLAAGSDPLPAEPEDPSHLVGLGLIEEDATVFQIRLREGMVWSDDTPITAQDVLTTTSILRHRSDVMWDYLESVEAVDDYTVNFVMSRPSTVVQRYVLKMQLRPTSTFGEWATRIDEMIAAGNDPESPEWAQLLDQFNQFRPESMVVSGPFTIDLTSVTNAELSMPKNNKAWNADQVKFDRIRNFHGSGEGIYAVILNGEVDYATQSFTPAVEQQLIETGQRIVRPPVYQGPAILFNFAKFPQLLDKRVRQAFAHVIDRAQNGQVALGESGVPVQYMSGMSDQMIGDWLDQADIDTLNQYEPDQDMATSLLEEAGWTKDGDAWVMADGTPAAFEMLIPVESPDWSAAGMDAAEQLSLFGIEVTPRAVPVAQQSLDTDQGNFDLSVRYWGTPSNPHPHFAYSQSLFSHNTLARNAGGEGIAFPLVQDTDVAGEVDLEQLTIESAEGLDTDAQRENVAVIAKVFNELLPNIPLFERFGNNSVLEGVRVASWPDDDHPIYQNSFYADPIVTMLMLSGELEPAGEA